MDDRPEPQRVEVELTSHGSSSGDGGAARGRVGGEPTGSPARGVLETERGRLVAVGSFAAVVALLIGVLLGRLGAGDEPPEDGSATATVPVSGEDGAVSASTEPDERSNGDTLPPAPPVTAPPPPTAPPVTVTVPGGEEDLEYFLVGSVEIDPSVPVAPIEVVALTTRGEYVRVNVVTGSTLTTPVAGSQFGPPSIHAGDGWVVIPRFDEQGGSIIIHDDSTREWLDTGAMWPPMADTARGMFWRVETDDSDGPPSRLVEVTVGGSPTGAIIDMSGQYPQMIDPRGGVVVQAPGGYYAMAPGSITRLTTGRALAVGVDVAVVHECDEVLDCGYFVVDRTTGDRVAIDLDPALTADGASVDAGGWWWSPEMLSPGADAVLVAAWLPGGGGRQVNGLIDLTTGDFEEIGAFVDTPAMAWAPDGGSVYWIDAGRLSVFDRATGESVIVSDDLDTISAFALRPILPSVDDPSPTTPDETDAG